MTNRYWVPLKYSVNSNSHLKFEFEGKIKFISYLNFNQSIKSETIGILLLPLHKITIRLMLIIISRFRYHQFETLLQHFGFFQISEISVS